MTTAVTDPLAVADAHWRRLSPRMLLIHPIIELGRAVPALIGLLVAGSSSGNGSAWGVIGALIVIGLGVLRWFTTRFQITPEQIQLRRGLVRRVTIAAPLDRVRTVDVTAHLLHRALGLAKVVIGTGTSDRKGRGGLVLDGLSSTAASRLRGELLHRDESHPSPAPGASEEQEIARLDPSWVRYAPFTLSGAITSVAVLGFGWRLNNEAHVNFSRLGPLRTIRDQLRHTSALLDVGAIMVAGIAIVSIAATIGYALAFWGFRLTRHDGGSLHVSRGLITSRATSIEARRLVGAEITEPLLLRAVGGARCLAIATGLRVGRGAERGGQVLLPPAPRGVAMSVAASVLGSAAPESTELVAHPRAALRRRLVRSVTGSVALSVAFGALVVLTGISPYVWFVSLGLVALAVPLAYDRYRSLGHAIVDGYVVTRIGSLVRRRSALSGEAIIGWNFASSFFQRRAGLTTLTATTAAGKQAYDVCDIAEDDAIVFADAASPGLLAQFAA